MPIYEYQCDFCQGFHEVVIPAGGSLLKEPENCLKKGCGGKLKRIVSRTSFVLKGSGWSKDGYSGKKS